MRKLVTRNGITVQAFSGTYTVTLGFNASEAARVGLLGFAIHRADHTEDEAYWLRGFKTFQSVVARPLPNVQYSLMEHPVQSFQWADYTAKPAHDYTYEVVPIYGKPKKLEPGTGVKVRIRTEMEERGKHSIYFNRGVAGSQAYASRFGNKRPEEIPNRKAFIWLSRGLEEALLDFIAQANSPNTGIRAALYEFNYAPVLNALKAAHQAGADVKIIYDARQDPPVEATRAAITAAGLPADILVERQSNASYISHNKFFVLLRRGRPVQVWTGSTNITTGGIFGQANVGHVVRDSVTARKYLAYWNLLAADPLNKDLRPALGELSPDLSGPAPEGITPIFSPRPDLDMLKWYGERLDAAKQTACLTAAFGVNPLFAAVLNKDRDYPRFLLLEKKGSNYDIYSADPDVQVSVGSHLMTGSLYQWMEERLTGLNLHVRYIHTKFLLVDPLGDDPLVITGSANFSEPSTNQNDENMLVIRGDTRVADIYLGEFMRLFSHFYFRFHANRVKELLEDDGKTSGIFLTEDDSWTRRYYNPDSPKFKLRKLFSGE